MTISMHHPPTAASAEAAPARSALLPHRAVTFVIGSLLMLACSTALAHATLVIGDLTVAPDPPLPGQTVRLTVSLVDPLLVPVEDALVRIEFREIDPEHPQVPASITGTEATDFLELPVLFGTEYLSETAAGVYSGSFTAPADGRYTVSVRDTTFRNEEAIANIGLNVGSGPNGRVAFVLPPTPMAPSSIGMWLLWIIGIPLVIGLIVTILALRGKPAGSEAAEAAAATEHPQEQGAD